MKPKSAFALVFLLLTMSPTQKAPAEHPPAPLEPSIVLRHAGHYKQIKDRVQRALDVGCRRLNFVVTVNCQLDTDHKVLRYGLAERTRQGWKFTPMTDNLRSEIMATCQAGLQIAADADVQIAILCHLDADTMPYVWRNYFKFDPLRELEGHSYYSSLLQPLAVVLSEVAPRARVDISVCGEMGTSLFSHPSSYCEVLERLRHDTSELDAALGISLNHNNVQGKSARIERQATSEDLQQFFDALDFVGFSNYHAVSVPPTIDDFRLSVSDFIADLDKNGVRLPPSATIHFSEIAIGGYGKNGRTDDPHEAAAALWEGTHVPDRSPWSQAKMRTLRLQYHQALLEFLRQQPATWPVAVGFIWSEGSWDPQGISTPHFVDPEIIGMIRDHNRFCYAHRGER